MEFTDKAEDKEQDDEVPEGSDQNNVLEVLPLAKLTSTTPISLSHVSNSSSDSKGISSDDLGTDKRRTLYCLCGKVDDSDPLLPSDDFEFNDNLFEEACKKCSE
ncbi:17323_t:CDS:2, partial [Racocetra fulgida]